MIHLIRECERWWQKTKNPLYVWEAIMISRNTSPPEPIPDWCLPYLSEAATSITNLAWATCRGEEEPTRARKKVAEKLGFVRQGRKNAFLRMLDDRKAMDTVLDARSGVSAARERLMADRSITQDRADRIRRRGARLVGLLR
jgi:hypothetical protein